LIARLVLEETEGTLDDDIPKDAWRDVDGLALSGHDDDCALANDATAKVDSTSDGQVVQLEDLGDGRDVTVPLQTEKKDWCAMALLANCHWTPD
jgi:hypothetical protein